MNMSCPVYACGIVVRRERKNQKPRWVASMLLSSILQLSTVEVVPVFTRNNGVVGHVEFAKRVVFCFPLCREDKEDTGREVPAS